MSQTQDEPRTAIDFPQQDEEIISAEYTFRVSAEPQAAAVEVFIDDGPWLPCRPAVGLWWYDWTGYECGGHEARVRVRLPDGRISMTAARRFRVELPEPAVLETV